MSKRRQRKTGTKQRPIYLSPWVIGGVVTVLAVGLLLFFVFSDSDPGEKYTDQGNRHLQQEPETYPWNSRPPTSGPHAPGLAGWGIHTETVAEWEQVHNLEDGGVILHYNCPEGCPDVVDELTSIVKEAGEERLILHPYPNMDSRIAVTAWTRLLTMETVDREKILDFINEYRGIDHH